MHPHRILAVTHTATVGRKAALLPEEATIGASTVGTREALWVEVAFQPDQTDTLAQEFGDREVNHRALIPHPARWLHMSQGGIGRL
jgi:hypothetical protein